MSGRGIEGQPGGIPNPDQTPPKQNPREQSREAYNYPHDEPFRPSTERYAATQANVAFGLYATQGQRMDVHAIHRNYEEGIIPNEIEITRAFGTLLREMADEGILRPINELDNQKPFVGYELTDKGKNDVESALNYKGMQTPDEREKRRREIADFKAEGAPSEFLARYVVLTDDAAAALVKQGWKSDYGESYEVTSQQRAQVDALLRSMQLVNPFREDAYQEGKQTPGERVRRVKEVDVLKSAGVSETEMIAFIRMTDEEAYGVYGETPRDYDKAFPRENLRES